MPTYQYACTSCGDELEVVQSFTDDALTDCPSCETGRLRKLFGNVGVVFKGSGFYRTDSRAGEGGRSAGGAKSAESSKPSADSSASSSSGSGTSTSGSSDSGSSTSSSSAKPSASKASATSAA